MATKAHIKIVQHPNPERRTFHVNRDVCNIHRLGFGKKEISCFAREEKPDSLTACLATALGYIPGVEEGHLQQYEVHVGKGEAFEWADIMPHVVGRIVAKIYPDLIGESIEVTTTMHYLVGEYSRERVVAKRFPIHIDIDPTDSHPVIDVEDLFNPNSLRLKQWRDGMASTAAAQEA
jgi:hypothetical protein